MKKRIPAAGRTEEVRELLRSQGLATVCQGARCPNVCECFARGTATFMILGERCTRDCGFCAVPHDEATAPDPTEPERLAKAAAGMGLRHVVVTSVTRDDLGDGGAAHFAETIAALRRRLRCTIEVLTPDFLGDARAIECVVGAGPDVFGHNVETVPRLYGAARPAARYDRSLDVLARAKEAQPGMVTKSGLMVGLGETPAEVTEVLRDLRGAGCDLLTIGQYLQPTPQHLAIERFVTPDEFAKLKRLGEAMGFGGVASGPFVRSSYRAGELLRDLLAARGAAGRGAEAI